jgi:hypothetical protein
MMKETRPGDYYRRMGSAIYGRLRLILPDEGVARRAADELFVRFLTRKPGAPDAASPGGHGNPDRIDTEAEWLWIYRVATNDALQRLADTAIPGGGAPSSMAPPARRALPVMAELRRLDELHANARVLLDLDGLGDEELERVLGALPDRLRKALAGSVARSAEHPSRLRLDAENDGAAVVSHLAACEDCARAVAQSRRRRAEFAQQIGPAEVARMAATIGAARARRTGRARRRRLTQAVVVTASLLAVCALALVVARPRTVPRAEIPYAGVKGASRTQASGIQITVRRDDATQALDPEATLRAGDRLLFRVRIERPRFLELRARQPTAGEVRVFPLDIGQALLVNPGQLLDRDFAVTATSGMVSVTARFADHPFPVDQTPGVDVEVVPVRIPIGPAPSAPSAPPPPSTR